MSHASVRNDFRDAANVLFVVAVMRIVVYATTLFIGASLFAAGMTSPDKNLLMVFAGVAILLIQFDSLLLRGPIKSSEKFTVELVQNHGKTWLMDNITVFRPFLFASVAVLILGLGFGIAFAVMLFGVNWDSYSNVFWFAFSGGWLFGYAYDVIKSRFKKKATKQVTDAFV